MITCQCGKTIDKVPDWFQEVTVEFICNNCPNRKRLTGLPGVEAAPDLPNMSKGEGAEEITDDEDEEEGDD